MKHKSIILLLLLLPFLAYTQSIILDDFSGVALKENWYAEGTTFTLGLENESMKIDYLRNENSWEWDQFHFNMDESIALRSYTIHLKIKVDIATQLTVKPVYDNGSDDWIQIQLQESTNWQEIAFEVLSEETRQLTTLFFYFDAGSTANAQGLFFMDDLLLETSSKVSLNKAVISANTYHDQAEEGSQEGQFLSGSKEIYASAIFEAQEVLDHTEASQEQIDLGLLQLNEATRIMELACIRDAVVSSETLILANVDATRETRNLYYNLQQLSSHHLLFGHHDVTAYGVNWTGEANRSDVKDVCGSYPAVASWDFMGIAAGNNASEDKSRVEFFHNQGGINTFCWHYDNPFGGDFYWENNPYPDSNVVTSLMPGGFNHESFVSSLDKIAQFCKTIKGSRGESIPIIFRPWHEHNGDWFWWGESHCSIQEYKELWQYTVDYLIEEKQVNNLLFSYSPDVFINKAKYLQRYPGDEYIDILGFDDYQDVKNESTLDKFQEQLIYVVEMAEERNKIAALTETGLERITKDNWFTTFLEEPIISDEVSKKIAYAVVWRNASTSHFYAPYPGHSSVPDFQDFYASDFSMFMDQLPELFNELQKDYNDIEELENVSSIIKAYPNPVGDQLHLYAEEEVHYQIFNSMGVQVDEGDLERNLEHIVPYPHKNGMYILVVTSYNKVLTSLKIVKH
ncbi:T9SS type A sorting domain-containing protein [Lentimicrobium sp. L6]|uniref:glycosyl hydrolase n=1 Tax=Lentimicrobium sp. L6 TaxID=2735916 RepID=UPI001555C0B6|nr:glycosyl hydrolase [Lentimicrobium sp. L6]NPD87008.1 T9SS type A sorting domain-containing protein [Lentimicrobium sp. L6]